MSVALLYVACAGIVALAYICGSISIVVVGLVAMVTPVLIWAVYG